MMQMALVLFFPAQDIALKMASFVAASVMKCDHGKVIVQQGTRIALYKTVLG